jgi:O-antigen biosynthesis protein
VNVASITPTNVAPRASCAVPDTGAKGAPATGPLYRARRFDPRTWRVAWLTLLVHLDAFLSAPWAYVQAVLWRVRGLRVRSKNRIAALAGRSPRAYALWIARREHQPREVRLASHSTEIWPVIDCRRGSAGLEGTLRSLSEAAPSIEPILIGADASEGTRRIARPRDLAKLMTRQQQWLLPIRPGDEIAGAALSLYARALQDQRSWLIYADDDLLGADGQRRAPHFKPDWNPELFEHHDFVTGSSIVKADREQLAKVDEANWVESLVRVALDSGGPPLHVQEVLHHRRSRPSPSVPAKPQTLCIGTAPSVTAIVPTRNRHELLRTCIEGLSRTDYPQIETIVVDNGSDDPSTLGYLQDLEGRGMSVLRCPGPFNYSALNNGAVKHATGDLLCFLNNDIEMTDGDWLALLVQHAVKPDIGAVGARLLYPDGTIQHAGVFTAIGGGAGHAHRFQQADETGYFDRARLPQRVSAVTGACMVVARNKFLAVGGFDEELFSVAFNDVDLCLKLNCRGWQSFYEPRATLVHHESKSRGSDRLKCNRARFAGELAALKRVWHTDEFRDPYHHPNLSPFCEQFLIAV